MNQYVLALLICAQTVSIKILISDIGQAPTKTLFLEKAGTFLSFHPFKRVQSFAKPFKGLRSIILFFFLIN